MSEHDTRIAFGVGMAFTALLIGLAGLWLPFLALGVVLTVRGCWLRHNEEVRS